MGGDHGNNQVSLKLLKDVLLKVNITTLDGINVNKTFEDHRLSDINDSTETIAVPNNPKTIKLTCYGIITIIFCIFCCGIF